ncbi:hypothetical protein K5M33_01875 [Chromobacterium vaccinii]|nr:hypothetical protein [Chromobacterium vaccinii]MBX9355456.1 hypothetical protein [Chromobacterium vaccinii]
MKDSKYHGIWICLLLLDGAGVGLGYKWVASEFSTLALSGYITLALLVSGLAAAPLIRFLVVGWGARYEEFRNRLNNGALVFYLRQFWQPRTDRIPALKEWPLPPERKGEADAAAESLFELIYREHYGRSAFIMPLALLQVAILLMVTLYALAEMEKLKLLVNNLVIVASIAGAYLFVVSDMVTAVRRRSLNVADVYWYALRMTLAIPIGAAVSAATSADAHAVSALQTVVAFAIGAFPMDVLMKLLRRLASRSFGASEQDQNSDQLIKLEGVTADIAAGMAAEGVNSIEQLIGTDPVLLSIRTGFPFKFILRLSSQAIVWRYFSDHGASLARLGLADVEAIFNLNEKLELKEDDPHRQQADKVVANAAACLQAGGGVTPDEATLRFLFGEICNQPYTRFLLSTLKQKNGYRRPRLVNAKPSEKPPEEPPNAA